MKRLVDLAVGLVLGCLCAPLLLVAALLVWLERRGEVFYATRRVGQGGRLFNHYRLRTMAGSPASKTPLGKALGNLSLDDLPTLWNVLRGDLSLVGPRPETPEKVDLGDPRWQAVLSVRPGLTGLSLVRLREKYNLSCPQERLHIELEYVQRQSAWLDCQILAQTVYWWLRMGHLKGRMK